MTHLWKTQSIKNVPIWLVNRCYTTRYLSQIHIVCANKNLEMFGMFTSCQIPSALTNKSPPVGFNNKTLINLGGHAGAWTHHRSTRHPSDTEHTVWSTMHHPLAPRSPTLCTRCLQFLHGPWQSVKAFHRDLRNLPSIKDIWNLFYSYGYDFLKAEWAGWINNTDIIALWGW